MDKIIVLVVIIFMLFALYKDIMQPAVVFLIAILIFFFSEIISAQEILHGLAVESGLHSLYLFNFAWVGIPVSILGIIYMIFIGFRFLPSRKNIFDSFSEQTRDYLVETIVPPISNLTCISVEKAQLRNLKDLYLVQVVRDDEIVIPVSPQEIIKRNDRLFFAGNTKKTSTW
jgi:di/tricarboxylate transporter